MSLRFIFILLVSLPFCVSDWSYTFLDDMVLSINGKNSSDYWTYENVINSLENEPRGFNDTLCRIQFDSILNGFENKEPWALKVMDSWGDIQPSGFYWGTMYDFGHFDECITTAHNLSNDDSNIFVGQYCLAKYPIEDIVPIKIERQQNSFSDRELMPNYVKRAVCVPDTCTVSILDVIFKERFYNSTGKQVTSRMFSEEFCTRNEYEELGDTGFAVIIILMTIGTLIVLSTSYDILVGYNGKKKNPILASFSVISNGRKLFNMQNKAQSAGSTECLNGLRFISIIWVCYGHSFITMPTFPLMNYTNMWNFLEMVHTMFVVNSSFCVDTFLVMTGFLLSYHMLKELDKRGTLTIGNIIWMYIHRYIRLFPLLGASLLFSIAVYKHLGSGPLWKSLTLPMTSKCEEYWWSTLLYVQNYVNPYQLCMTHTWYLSVDLQLYFLAPFILIPLHKWGKKFVAVVFVLIAASTTYIFVVGYDYKISLRNLETLANAQEKTKAALYTSAQGRCNPWFIGILLGYYLHNLKGKTMRIPKLLVLAGWISCGALALAVIFGPHSSQTIDAVQDDLASAFYTALSRTTWSLPVAWIIFACHQGYGGYVNAFLSYPLWQVLARLTYAIYLIHPFVQLSWTGTARTPVYHTPAYSVKVFWGDFGIILTIAILCVLALESPAIALEKALLRGNRPKKDINDNETRAATPQWTVNQNFENEKD